ncbi:hypothetical protein CR513_40423, partial [Mucuna pruriens]
MGRWMKPEVYPLVGAMTFVTTMVVFQLSRNLLTNPDSDAIWECWREIQRTWPQEVPSYLTTRDYAHHQSLLQCG